MVELLGTIKIARELGKKTEPTQKYIWAACVDCGKERWVILLRNQPKSPRCVQCASSITGKKYTKNRYGENNPYWKGGQYIDGHGYVLILAPKHPRSRKKGYIGRAILVLEQKLGRYLLDGHVAHHINGVKDDDRPENLCEMLDSDHKSLTFKELKLAENLRKFRWPK